jgi:hypothetical protein
MMMMIMMMMNSSRAITLLQNGGMSGADFFSFSVQFSTPECLILGSAISEQIELVLIKIKHKPNSNCNFKILAYCVHCFNTSNSM